MGIIRAAVNAVHGSLADQWLETVEPYEMGEHTVFTEGILVRKGQNKKGSQTISNGSVIHVYDNQFMMLVDGGKIIDYTAEPGYFTVDQSSSPSMFSGSLDAAVKDTFERLKFGGQTPHEQRVFYINLQEIKGIKFGTRNPVNYFDQFYNAELFLRAHGSYSIRIVDPLRFYAEAVPRNASRVEIEDINEQYMNEFLEGLQSSINQMAADGIRISFAASKSAELSRYMAIRSRPMPKAKPLYSSESMPQFSSTRLFTIPAPRTSIQPVPLQRLHPFPPQAKQLQSTSTDGSVNGK